MYLLQHHLGLYFPNIHQASELAVNLNKDVSKMKETFCDLYAINPSFALQGSRTSITHPWITELQGIAYTTTINCYYYYYYYCYQYVLC